MQSTSTAWAAPPPSHSHNWFRKPWGRKQTINKSNDMSSLLNNEYGTQQGSGWSHSSTTLSSAPSNNYNPNTQYNQYQQYGQSAISLSSSTIPYGSAKADTIQNIFQEMEQDEELRLAQVRQDSKLLAEHPFYDKQKYDLLGRDRSRSLGRHELPINTKSIYVAQLPDFGSRNSLTLAQADAYNLNKTRPHVFEMEDCKPVRAIELDVPDIKISYPNNENSYTKDQKPSLSDSDCKSDSKDWPASDNKPDAHELPQDQFFSDVDTFVSSKQNPYASRRASTTSATELESGSVPVSHARPRPMSKLPDLPELADPVNLSPRDTTADKRPSSVSLPVVQSTNYHDKRYRTLAGEAFPLTTGRWSG